MRTAQVTGAREQRPFLGRAVRHLGISHPARDQLAVATKAEESLTKSMRQKVTFRTRDEVAAFFAGLELLAPGVVRVQSWRPTSELDINSAPTAMWGGVGYKG